jgi:protein involved in polysaccharide export with SLBB domain
VRQPGQYQIYEPIDILKAVAMCGGLQNLKVKTIRLIRGDGTVVPVETKTLWGNEGKRDTKKYVLYPGDTMYVPDTFEIPWAIILSVLTIIVLSLEIVIYTNSLSHK